MEMSQDDTALGESNTTVERSLHLHNICKVVNGFFEAEDCIGRQALCFVPRGELEPGSVVGAPLGQESFQLLGWLLRTFEWSVNVDKVYNLVENIAEVAHLVLNHVGVTVVAMKAEHTQFALQFLLKALRASILSQIKVAKHWKDFLKLIDGAN